MKKYQNEEEFVKNFAKDAKQGIKENGNFEAVVNDVEVVVVAMDNNNASKVTIYSGSIDGKDFQGSITALKKRLNVTYTKEYARGAEGTKVSIKSDEELEATAKTADERIKAAIQTLNKYAKLYAIPIDVLASDGYDYDNDEGQKVHVTAYELIFDALKQKRDNEVERRANEAKRKAEELEAKLKEAKAKLERQIAEMQAKLAKM